MTIINLFLDTEFTKFESPELISIGLVKNSTEFFYQETNDFNINNCSNFVVKNVLPLLQGINSSLESIRAGLNEWIEILMADEIIIIGDFWGDWLLLKSVLNKNTPIIGFVNINDFYTQEAKKKTFTLNPKIIQQEYNFLIDKYFSFTNEWLSRHDKKAHHALNDALASHYAFTQSLELIDLLCERE